MNKIKNILKRSEFHVETEGDVSYVYMTSSQLETFKNLKKEHGFKVIRARQCDNMIIAAVSP